MTVLSLFDGISCGRLALQRAGIQVDQYFASEIKKFAIKVTQTRFPDTIQLGDVRTVKASDLPKIDILIGGSPCQDFSNINQKQLGLKGMKSSLFYEYLRLLKETKPKFFLLENVLMKEEDQKTLTKLLGGVQPIQIDSRLVSAQSRRRLYWTNIPGVHEPDDRHISFQSILEDGYTPREKSICLLASAHPHKDVAKKFRKSFGTYMENNIIFKNKEQYEKCKEIYFSHFTYDRSIPPGLVNESVFSEEEKAAFDGIRYLYPVEMERLQTLPEGYCSELITHNQVRNVCGDGWTVDVLAHLFSCIRKFNTLF